MKKAIKTALAFTLCIVLTIGLLSGCGNFAKGSLDLSDTIWEYVGDYYVFNPDGSIQTYNADGILYEGFEGAYVVEGNVCKMVYGGAAYTVTMEEGRLIATNEQNLTFRFEPVDSFPTAPEGTSDEEVIEDPAAAVVVDDPNALDLRNTSWETEGLTYEFYADGSVKADNGSATKMGSYTWNGQNGSLTMDEATVPLVIADGQLCIEAEDGYLYVLLKID